MPSQRKLARLTDGPVLGRSWSLGLVLGLAGCNQILGNTSPDATGSGGTIGANGGSTSSGGASTGGVTGGGGAPADSGGTSSGGTSSLTCAPACPTDQGCVAGSCMPILAECMGQAVGTRVCSADGTSSFVCGESLAVKDGVETCEAFCRNSACVLPPSCVGLPTTCGPSESSTCCASPVVTGGDFGRGSGSDFPASVSDFRLDKYEVTVGRFRKFVAALVVGWLPDAGNGKHTHLRGGLGLVGTTGGDEPGWDSAWSTGGTEYRLFSGPDTEDDWDMSLDCGPNSTWTAVADLNETLPINCVNWYQAAAFCIWDGGFLPSEAEWEYAAAGGAAERFYPWGAAPPDAAHAVYACIADGSIVDNCMFSDIRNVGSAPDGDGLFGQSDLAGSMWEWTFDWYVTPYAPGACEDCAHLTAGEDGERTAKGASWESDDESLQCTWRTPPTPDLRDNNYGIRCARVP